MRYKNQPLPSQEESRIETNKRLKILEEVLPKLKKFSEAVIVGGTVAYGKNYSVRKESDIDILILINRENTDKIFECELFELIPQIEEERELFKQKVIDNFNVSNIIDGVDVQFFFWDKEVYFKAILFEKPTPKIYNIWDKEYPNLPGLDFTGKEREYHAKDIQKVKYGLVHDYPFYFIEDGNFVPRTPILNLIAAPDILFAKDKEIFEHIEKIWENLAKRLILESNGKIDLSKKNIFFSIYGNWNLSSESKKKIENKIEETLKKVQETFGKYPEWKSKKTAQELKDEARKGWN